MRLSHIHEDPLEVRIVKNNICENTSRTLADYFNKNKIYPYKMYGPRLRTAGEKIEIVGGGIRGQHGGLRAAGSDIEFRTALSMSWWDLQDVFDQGLKTIGYELIKYEPIPELDNPLDDIIDIYGNPDQAMFAAVIEGFGEFEGQFAWYNEDLTSYRQIRPLGSKDEATAMVFSRIDNRGHQAGLYWEKGRPPLVNKQSATEKYG
jgi:hypothetical protein